MAIKEQGVKVRTYNPKQVKVYIGGNIVQGLADDTFINITPNSDGTSTIVGCDGEINRAISVDQTYKVTLTLLQNSTWDAYLFNTWTQDQENGTGYFSFSVRDIMGNEEFYSDCCWIEKVADWQRGKDVNKREWTLHTAWGKFAGSGEDWSTIITADKSAINAMYQDRLGGNTRY